MDSQNWFKLCEVDMEVEMARYTSASYAVMQHLQLQSCRDISIIISSHIIFHIESASFLVCFSFLKHKSLIDHTH